MASNMLSGFPYAAKSERKDKLPEIVRAKEPFSFTSKNGVPRVITPGDLVSTDDPDYVGREHLFESVTLAAARATEVASSSARATETASAAPEETRVMKRPATRPAVVETGEK